MGTSGVFTGFFLITAFYMVFLHEITWAAPGNANLEQHRPRTRPFSRVLSREKYARMKNEPFSEFMLDDDDVFELSKRQTSDDYGHLRFGKRDETFDDYGHMRFGRSGNDK